ncbi:hypothetical protein M413DRAFT_13544 [Hebeloma cylindrosporum]|uniref:Uncharacterized protein n=1 Tax=Hebeloma cylindrosporum TaxID=76867 RepID=A0A0C2XH67_HEBCY|nr:hypothetical protein M413DRAFT_13544 [Hebeloma cylindrosporum h7]
MVFRLPSQLETLIPAPADQRSQPTPWRGSLLVSGMRNSDRNSNLEIYVTAVETDGEKYVEYSVAEYLLIQTHPSRAQQWPQIFYARVLHEQPVLREFQTWMKNCVPPVPLGTFMSNRLREPNMNTVNQTNFRSLSRILFENQTIAVASWAPNTFPGAGMIIYPAQNSGAVLVGALFLDTAFPNFVGGIPSPISPVTPTIMQQSSRHYQQRVVPVSPMAGLPPTAIPNGQPIAAHRQDAYRYIIPRSGHSAYPGLGQPSSSSDVHAWSGIKTEEENGYGNYASSHQHAPYP